jgi:ABC-2 type transport system ATP-binding protein
MSTNTSREVIVAQGLTKRFGDFVAVDHVSFTIREGEVVGYLGPNGSGKTTTIRMLLGLLLPSEGQARVLGFDIVREAEPLRAQVGYMSQKFALYQELTVAENLAFYAGVYGVRQRERIDQVIDQVGLRDHAGERAAISQPAGGSGLPWACYRPPAASLFLDEPTSGVDPTAPFILGFDHELVDGVTAPVTTHYMDEANTAGGRDHARRKLLAMDSPPLKQKALPGLAWDVIAQPILKALQALETCPCVLRAGLTGDHLRAITPADVDVDSLRARLQEAGIQQAMIVPVEPTLEDVFLALSVNNQEEKNGGEAERAGE